MDRYCKMLNKLWLNALIMVVLASLIAVIYVWQLATERMVSGNMVKYYPFVAMVIMILCLFIGNNLTAKRIRRLKGEELSKKLAGYKSEYAKRLKWFSGISFVAVLSMVLFVSMYYMIFAMLSLLLIITARIIPLKIKYELNLNEDDVKQIGRLKF
jgi:heme/copper-type cytochrome/quinol oxidase subunit 1